MTSPDERHDPALERLLGPTGYEVTCDECFELLDEYVEVELQGEAAHVRIPGMRTHFDGCPACREEYESLRALVAGDRPVGD